MPSVYSLERAAQAWCKKGCTHKVMDVELAEAFAAILDEEREVMWGLLANAGCGDWARETDDWQRAATRWRNEYNRGSTVSEKPDEPEQPKVKFREFL